MIYKEGMKGLEMIRRIQRVVGCYPDSNFGPRTTEALKAWQKAHGLTADGVAGPATLAKMGLSAAVQSMTPSKTTVINHSGIILKKSKRRIDYIVVHCTATPEGQQRTVEQIRNGHLARGWSDIGYHYVVTLDGKVHLGRDVDISGSHVSGYNSYSIGVVYVGGLENKPGVAYEKLKAKDTRTDAQKAALMSLLIDLRKLYPNAKILGHRDFPKVAKACPSFNAIAEFSRI